MATRNWKPYSAGPGKEKKNPQQPAETGEDEFCRCRETSQMKPRQLLKLMISDLAFWKKGKK